jgi:large conductance mechanosensitive channel
MIKGFRDFILRGNVVDLAIAVLIGVAFGAVVTAVTKDLLTPLIAAIGGQPNFSALSFTVHHSVFRYGDVVNAVISFLVVAAVIYFLVVVPLNRLVARQKADPESPPAEKPCPECLSLVPAAATRCAFCTVALAA